MAFYWTLVIFASVFLGSSLAKIPIFKGKDAEAIAKLRNAVGSKLKLDYMKTDAYLHKWLKTKHFDHNKAVEAIEKTLEWRKKENIDNLPFEKFDDALSRFVVDTTTARDKEGRPVSLFPFADWDLRRMAVAGRIQDVVRVAIRSDETSAQVAFNLTGDATGMALADLNGYSLRKHGCVSCLPYYIGWVTHHEAHYPYIWYRILIFNAPSIFDPVTRLLRSYMSPGTREAFKVMGHNRAEWQAYVAETVDLSQLPFRFGGPITA